MEKSQEQEAILIIADISGYTRFILSNRMSLLHGQIIITELTKAIIAQVDIPLEISKLQGDAIFRDALKTHDASSIFPGRSARKLLAFLTAVSDKLPELCGAIYRRKFAHVAEADYSSSRRGVDVRPGNRRYQSWVLSRQGGRTAQVEADGVRSLCDSPGSLRNVAKEAGRNKDLRRPNSRRIYFYWPCTHGEQYSLGIYNLPLGPQEQEF
jgi:hypothetical protein